MATSLLQPEKITPITADGQKVSDFWFRWFLSVYQVLSFSGLASNQASNLPGINAVITTAKLTGGGANGSMTFTNGILTAQTQAT